MDFKKQSHKYLEKKGCLSIAQKYTAFEVENMLSEFAQQQLCSFNMPYYSPKKDDCDHDFKKLQKP